MLTYSGSSRFVKVRNANGFRLLAASESTTLAGLVVLTRVSLLCSDTGPTLP